VTFKKWRGTYADFQGHIGRSANDAVRDHRIALVAPLLKLRLSFQPGKVK